MEGQPSSAHSSRANAGIHEPALEMQAFLFVLWQGSAGSHAPEMALQGTSAQAYLGESYCH